MENKDKEQRFVLRIPHGLQGRIKLVAAENRRSINSEIIFQLEKVIRPNEETKKGDVTA